MSMSTPNCALREIGSALPPMRPGFGIDLDEKVATKYSYEEKAWSTLRLPDESFVDRRGGRAGERSAVCVRTWVIFRREPMGEAGRKSHSLLIRRRRNCCGAPWAHLVAREVRRRPSMRVRRVSLEIFHHANGGMCRLYCHDHDVRYAPRSDWERRLIRFGL